MEQLKCANCGVPIVAAEEGYTHVPTTFIAECIGGASPTPHPMSDDGKGRDEYTWRDLGMDLAFMTRLTAMEAGRVRYFMEPTGRHPYDALPHLVTLFGDGPVEDQARALAYLVNGDER